MNPQSLNRYAYVLNNPTTLIDPLGLHYEPWGGYGRADPCNNPWYSTSHPECPWPSPLPCYIPGGCGPPGPRPRRRGGGGGGRDGGGGGEVEVIYEPGILTIPPEFPTLDPFSIADLLGLPDPFQVGPVLTLRGPSGAVVFQWPYYVSMAAEAIKRCLMNPGCAARLVVALQKGAKIAQAAGSLGAQTVSEVGRQFGALAVGGDPRYWEEKLRIIDEMKRSGQWETAGAVPTVGNQAPYVITVTGRR